MTTTAPEIKICCIGDLEEASRAVEMGASALGLVSAMPSGPGVISESKIREIALAYSGRIETFLLTSKTSPSEIIEQHQTCTTSTIQLVDSLSRSDLEILRRELRGIRLVQVVHVQNRNAVSDAVDVAEVVDAVLLDSGNTTLETRELGGTGRIHDWSISAEIVRSVQVPVYLAGGIGAGNVRDAMRTVQPYGLDLCSSVRTKDKLDPKKLRKFMAAVDAAVKGPARKEVSLNGTLPRRKGSSIDR